MAISASGACRLPTWRCASPCWLRMKISQSGHSFCIDRFSSLSRRRDLLAGSLLLGVGKRRFAHLGSLLPSIDARLQTLPVAGTVAVDDLVKLLPVDRPKIVVAALG